ncbi:MAG: hypothetical protein H0V44_01110 [Planctomycetes bacterium]|nr:hypothetical protein [Planctomycetota bacterium]
MTLPAKPHAWTFFRVGGFDQVSLTTADDIASIGELDQKLWAALACPVKGLEFDERTLALIDTDNDGRVRAPEIVAAVGYADTYLVDIGAIRVGTDQVPIASIDASTPIGKAMVSCAQHILKAQGKPDEPAITLLDVEKAREHFAKTPFNGDGVITASAAADDAETKQAILDIMSTHGSIVDRDGQPGLNKKLVDGFFADAAAYDAWWKATEANPAQALPLGAGTLPALAAIDAIKTKIDDWFARCSLAAYDERAQQALNGTEKAYLAIASRDLVITTDEIRSFPLSLVKANAPLPLEGALNPFWAAAVATLRTLAVRPLLGADRTTLDEQSWQTLQERFAGTRAWVAQKAGAAVEKLGLPRVRALLASDSRARIEALIARDVLFATEYDSITPVEKLVRLHRDLYRLLHNFVNFADFYSRDRLSVFQAGTLYLDSRACELAVRVDDPNKHGALAGLSKIYLAYCDCVRLPPSGPVEKMTVAAAFTAGDSDNLLVGRNGIFYDRKGRDWDATIVKVVENPISIRQAFWAPYKRAIRFVEEMVAKRAAAADQAADAKVTTGIATTAAAAETGKGPQKPKLDLTLITGIGVAIGGIATALSGFLLALFGLGKWMPLGFGALILGISLPSMVIAALKLRQRNLGPILDANGWAVNGRVKINIPFGGSLTELPRLPENSKRSLVDPYAEKKRPWALYIVLAVLAILGAWTIYDKLRHERWWWTRLQETEPQAATITISATAAVTQ